MAATIPDQRIPLSSVCPKYLHSNSTSHTWAFSAIAELIDNAYDPDVSAKQLWIDKTEIQGQECLIFMDNGKGMDFDKMHKMLSFGFSDKKAVRGHLPIGFYGNGFKSGSMRLGKDAIVFSKKANNMCVGLLSQTYLEKIRAHTVTVPIVMFTKTRQMISPAPGHEDSLHDILKYSLFNTEEELLPEFNVIYRLCAGSSGTRIIIWNLHRDPSGKLELDFQTDCYDIRIPTDVCKDITKPNKSQAENVMSVPKNEYSLRAYCSILYLKPRIKIILRGQKVETLYITKTLAKVNKDSYKPAALKGTKGIPITFGYNTKSKEHYGLMMYYKNRLIKAYERVACQRKANKGVGVIGVLECNHLTPIHNKQDFDKSEEFRRTIITVGNKLQDYYKEVYYRHKVNPNCTDAFEDTVTLPDQTWVQCDQCLKWRKIPDGIDNKQLPEEWFCYMNADPQFRSCEVEEEPDSKEARFQKTHKQEEQIQKIEQKRQQEGSPSARPVLIMPNPSNDIQDMYLSKTPKRKKKLQELVSAEKKARIADLDEMPDLSTSLPALFSHYSNDKKIDCEDLKESLKYDNECGNQSSSDYQQNYTGLYLQTMEAMKHLQDKLMDLRKMIKQEGVDTMMNIQEYEQWKNLCETLQNDLEIIKTENVAVSIQDCAAHSTKPPYKGEGSLTWKKEIQERSRSDEIQSLPELRAIRQNLTRLLVSYVPLLELDQITNKVLTQVLDGITPTVASELLKGTKSPDEDIFFAYTESKEEDNQSTPTEPPHNKYHCTITDVFSPESVKHNAKSDSYRFLCSHAGQFHCKLTDIIFELKAKGEVLYTVESWDNSQLQGMGQYQPAGPLYSITCSEDSVHYMHFPHCEINNGQTQIDLAVAHFNDGNVEIIQPLKITNTYVIFEAHGLSLFGLLKKIFWETPISAQVLLFYNEVIGMQRRKKLHIHLLPGNVNVEEVQKRHPNSTYLPCSSTCQLTPGKKYRPFCEPHVSQPKAETFCRDYGPNYHPTYEVIFSTEVEDLTLGLLDEIGQEVWEPRHVLLTAEMRERGLDQIDNDADFVDKHRDILTERVVLVTGIADTLLTRRMISSETYSEIGMAATSQQKMRILYTSLDSGGRLVKTEFYKILNEKEPYLVNDLSTSNNA